MMFLVFVFPDELTLTQVFKVLVVVPELEIVTLGLEPSHLVKDAKVCSAVLRTKLLGYLFQQLNLLLCQERLITGIVNVKVLNCSIFLD